MRRRRWVGGPCGLAQTSVEAWLPMGCAHTWTMSHRKECSLKRNLTIATPAHTGTQRATAVHKSREGCKLYSNLIRFCVLGRMYRIPVGQQVRAGLRPRQRERERERGGGSHGALPHNHSHTFHFEPTIGLPTRLPLSPPALALAIIIFSSRLDYLLSTASEIRA